MHPPFAERLRKGHALGTWCGLGSFSATELLAGAGFDFLILDLQHSELTLSHFPSLLGAFTGKSTIPVVRAQQNDYFQINWLFDQGAHAVVVPMANSPEAARRAVEAAKFPPVGRRSFAPVRPSDYGRRVSMYVRDAAEQSTLILQVESAEACRNIDAILDVPGFDAIFLGPNDIALSMLSGGQTPALRNGIPVQVPEPECQDLIRYVQARCQARGMIFGTTANSIAEARQWLQSGVHFTTAGGDLQFLSEGVRQVTGLPG